MFQRSNAAFPGAQQWAPGRFLGVALLGVALDGPRLVAGQVDAAFCPSGTVSTGAGTGVGGCKCAPGYSGSVSWNSVSKDYSSACSMVAFKLDSCALLYVDCINQVAPPFSDAHLVDSDRKDVLGNPLVCGCATSSVNHGHSTAQFRPGYESSPRHRCIHAEDAEGACCEWSGPSYTIWPNDVEGANAYPGCTGEHCAGLYCTRSPARVFKEVLNEEVRAIQDKESAATGHPSPLWAVVAASAALAWGAAL